jgi:ABC-2 type transport system ATP-binding protein
MDEAERCHRLAYIAYGKLLVTGSAAEVVAHSGLSTYVVGVPGGGERELASLARELEGEDGVTTVVPFGTTLHVSGIDADALRRVRDRHAVAAGQRWTAAEPSLDDVFVRLMQQAHDDFA